MSRPDDAEEPDPRAANNDLELLQMWGLSLAGLDFVLIASFAIYAILHHTPLSLFLHPAMTMSSNPVQLGSVALIVVNLVTGGMLVLLAKCWLESRRSTAKTSAVRAPRSRRRLRPRLAIPRGGRTWADEVLAEWQERQDRRGPSGGGGTLP